MQILSDRLKNSTKTSTSLIVIGILTIIALSITELINLTNTSVTFEIFLIGFIILIVGFGIISLFRKQSDTDVFYHTYNVI
jgi:hypothetical protein